MIRKIDDKNMNQRRGKQKQRNITKIHSLINLLLHKTPRPIEDLRGGTMAAKISPPPCNWSGVVGTRALEELEVNDRLLQENKVKVRAERSVQQ